MIVGKRARRKPTLVEFKIDQRETWASCLIFSSCEFSWTYNNCWSDVKYSLASGKVDVCIATWPQLVCTPGCGGVPQRGPACRLHTEGSCLQGKCSPSTGQVFQLCLCWTALLSKLSKHLLLPQGLTPLTGEVKASVTPHGGGTEIPVHPHQLIQ